MLKSLQARLQRYENYELPEVQAGFRKGKEPEIKLPTSTGSQKKLENSRKTSTSASLTILKPLTQDHTSFLGIQSCSVQFSCSVMSDSL